MTMKEVKIGDRKKIGAAVTDLNTAAAVKSGELNVFATPMMIALIEQCSAELMKEYLDEGETSVGTFISVSHVSATPVGMQVYAESEIISVNGREVAFSVKAYDEAGLIGEGEHKRFAVMSEKFQKKADSKIAGE